MVLNEIGFCDSLGFHEFVWPRVIPTDLFVCLWINFVRLGEYVLGRSRNLIVFASLFRLIIYLYYNFSIFICNYLYPAEKIIEGLHK